MLFKRTLNPKCASFFKLIVYDFLVPVIADGFEIDTYDLSSDTLAIENNSNEASPEFLEISNVKLYVPALIFGVDKIILSPELIIE